MKQLEANDQFKASYQFLEIRMQLMSLKRFEAINQFKASNQLSTIRNNNFEAK